MSLIVGTGIDKCYGAHDVLSNINFKIENEDRIGLVGPNGEGKTTVLRVIAGLEEPTGGTLSAKRDLRLGYLPQDPPSLSAVSLWESTAAVFAGLRRLEADLHSLGERLASDGEDEALLAGYSALQMEFERLDGYSYENRIKTVLTGLGFTADDHHRGLAELSGGQRTRALLGRLLLEEPDLLLLDEPTNHLDLEAVEWLESWLQTFRGGLVVVSHDRYFLDAVTHRTWEIAFRRLETYRGRYSAYVQQREARYRERLRRWEEQQEYIAKNEEFIRRHIAGQRTREAQGRRTRLERFLRDEAVERPEEPQHIRVRLNPEKRSGDIVLQLNQLVVGYRQDKPLLHPPDVEVRRGMRVAVVGPNGVGKTTLMRTILGEVPALRGGVRIGASVKIGYLSQTHDYLDASATVLDALLQAAPDMPREKARTLLGSFLFSGDEAFKTISQLSGGQRSRVALARLVVQDANLLVLDEPTNHLDIASQEILQEVLQTFAGTILLVSHDRYLIQSLATHVWIVSDGGMEVLEGGWDAYTSWRLQASEPPSQDLLLSTAQTEREAQKQARRERKQLERLHDRRHKLEADIQRLEEKLAGFSDRIGAAGEAQDMERVHKLGARYRATEKQLEALWEEWEKLAAAIDTTG